ncbi:choice-of-anchor D domain-containing protein [Winogradskyella sp. SYSU M77433]|uniref:choice-of-anchor D domain-containing protein n=1 Tax=Winogradskyella sp. SYSU M77433 TaxID=3042722 RepID=UPI00247FC633|nr:choice-of-anchor D domain-containing protein [Winogradskyella sp. SYSU M77433]MDH7912268.1 choice-of-anchor D domain-containing protein [Winogradskyella sp. SYSU M77433]
MKKNYYVTLIFLCLSLTFGFGQTTIAIQDFETVPATPTLNYSFNTGSFDSVSGNSGTGDSPQNSPMYSSSNTSWRVRNTTIDADFGPIDITSYQSVQVEFNLAGFSIGSTGNGLDAGDYVDVYISLDNGASWSYEMEITGNSNARWAFNSGSNRTITYDGDDNPNSFSSTNADPIDNIIINIPDSDASLASNFLIGFVIYNNNSSETWNIDDIQISGISSSPCVSPTTQPTGLTLSNITGSSIDGSFTAASADEYLVVASTSPTLGANPVDTTTYTNGDSLGSGVVVQSSSATTFTATGLTQNTPYYFYIFSLNGSGCSGGPLYYTTNPLANNATTISGPCASTGFESGEPTGWSNNGSYYNGGTSNTGTQKAGMNSNNDWISTDQLSNPSDISFWARTSGTTSDYTITIQYSIDEITWFDSNLFFANGGNSGDITTTYQQFNINLNLTGNYYLRWYMSDRAGGSFYLDDVEVYCGTSTPEPEIQLVDNTTTNQNCGYTIDFGSIANDGSSADLTFDITNIGSLDLNVSSLNITGDYSIVSPTTSFVVAASASQTVTVRFTPTTTGTLTGTLTINNNDLDESACTVSLTGEGFTPTPEIDIERNTGGSIPNGAAANAGYNTVFAATVIGNSSAPKTFHVSSEGSANIDLTSITSSNPSEFSVSLNPSPATVNPGTEVDFEITFTPTGVGLRTATITIVSNDTDENPYTFNVQGNGECTAGTLTLSPDNGPVNTIVNVTTSSSNFGGSTTATVNGITATVNIISSTELEVTIPTGAETGSLDITDNLGCVSSELFTVIDEQISSCEGSFGTAPTDLFISEVTDHGSGSHSYVEIYNGTGSTVDLTDYEIRLHNNGASIATHTIALTGSVVDNDVFVLAFGSTDATNPYATHGYDQSSGVSGINEDDNIRLYYAPTNTWVDLWGDTSGSVFTVSSNNYTYRRKNSGITAPSTIWDANDWDSFSPVDYSDVGTYDFSTGVPPTVIGISSSTTACNEVTISVSASEGFSGSNPLAYYWYAYDPANAGLGWQAISNGSIYTTSTASPDLIISDTGSVLDFQFYCQVRENDASCYDASNAIKVILSGATWDGTNWIWNDGTATDTMPNITTNVIINGNFDTSAGGVQTSFSACSLVVNNGFDLDITNGRYIEISNDITANGNITVFPQGSVVQIDDLATVTGSGTMTVQKETTLLNTQYDYTYWSSPVVGETIENLFGLVPNYGKHYFEAANFVDVLDEIDNTNIFNSGQDDLDDDGNDWQPASGTMQAGVGYAAMPSVGGPAFPVAQQFAFVGPFNNGVVSQPLVNNSGGVYNDWNFIGNPYPSAISTATFFSVNSGVTDAIYLWNQATPPNATASGSDGQNFSASDYAVISASGVNTAGGDTSLIPNDYVPSGQGFFIEAQTTGPIVFNNSMRVTGNNNQFFRSYETNKEVLWLNLTSDNGVANQLAVAHLEGATDLNDGTFYDVKRNMSSPVHAALYSTIAGEDTEFVIQGKNYSSLDLDEVITLGFKTTIESPTTYTISIAQFVGAFYTDNDIYLKDNLLNITHNIKNSDYNFTSTTGVFNNRFEVVFVIEALSINDNVISANDITISELQNDEVRFSTSKKVTITNVEILDVLGRQIYNLKGNSSTETYNLSQLSNAAYIAKISLSNGQVISKKAIKQR